MDVVCKLYGTHIMYTYTYAVSDMIGKNVNFVICHALLQLFVFKKIINRQKKPNALSNKNGTRK